MTTIGDLLRPEDVLLDIQATTPEAAVEEVAGLLRHDERVLDWEALAAGFRRRSTCLAVSADFGICLPHNRTDEVTEMVMSVGRSLRGIQFADCQPPVRYLFCIGVQHAMAADYLRIVGLLARIAREPASEALLRAAVTGQEFVEALMRLEARL